MVDAADLKSADRKIVEKGEETVLTLSAAIGRW
jgi:hypothetical protein